MSLSDTFVQSFDFFLFLLQLLNKIVDLCFTRSFVMFCYFHLLDLLSLSTNLPKCNLGNVEIVKIYRHMFVFLVDFGLKLQALSLFLFLYLLDEAQPGEERSPLVNPRGLQLNDPLQLPVVLESESHIFENFQQNLNVALLFKDSRLRLALALPRLQHLLLQPLLLVDVDLLLAQLVFSFQLLLFALQILLRALGLYLLLDVLPDLLQARVVHRGTLSFRLLLLLVLLSPPIEERVRRPWHLDLCSFKCRFLSAFLLLLFLSLLLCEVLQWAG